MLFECSQIGNLVVVFRLDKLLYDMETTCGQLAAPGGPITTRQKFGRNDVCKLSTDPTSLVEGVDILKMVECCTVRALHISPLSRLRKLAHTFGLGWA